SPLMGPTSAGLNGRYERIVLATFDIVLPMLEIIDLIPLIRPWITFRPALVSRLPRLPRAERIRDGIDRTNPSRVCTVEVTLWCSDMNALTAMSRALLKPLVIQSFTRFTAPVTIDTIESHAPDIFDTIQSHALATPDLMPSQIPEKNSLIPSHTSAAFSTIQSHTAASFSLIQSHATPTAAFTSSQ